SVHGLQGRAGIHERAEESAEGSRQKVEFYLRGTPLRKRIAIYLFTMLAFATLCGITTTSAARKKPAPGINAEKIRAHVKYLSSDELEGRGTGQRGGDLAAGSK